ncbi:MAG: hypothetical protein ACKVJG_19355 [Candidatus Latescibacterota bacterium]|jgi:hypothetical protein
MKREGEVEQDHSEDITSQSETVLEAPGVLARDAPRAIEREALCRAFLEEMLAAGERDIVVLRRKFLARAI